MKTVLTLTAGLLFALAPAGAASAGETGNGVAWGNCGWSSAGGDAKKAPYLADRTGKGIGNGGVQQLAKDTKGLCVQADPDLDPDPAPAPEVEVAVVVGSDQ